MNSEIKEDFCGACAAIPLAFVGVGISGYGATGSKKEYKRRKQIMFWSGIATIVLALAIIVYYKCIKKDCTECEG